VRIFLSYGHDEYASLARRIKVDLETRGHEVWFDADRLKPGRDWEQYIEEGIDWVSAVPDAGRFLLLMTPHSVRRPDGYCLNELARAYGRGLPILPVMVFRVEPPLSICRLQWLDMRSCFPVEEHTNQYLKQFDQLTTALRDKQVPFEGVQQRLLNYLQPINYDDDVDRHLSGFTGREWVMTEVNEWLDSSKRVLWITGEAGVGKSALAAWLCTRRPEIVAYHFCRFGNSERVDARRALFSIAYQLSTQLPGYQNRLNESSLDKTISEANAASIFDRLLVSLLPDTAPNIERPQVLLVDGLDEATKDGNNQLAALIASEFHRLPPWLRLIVTSRPHEQAINFALQALDPWKLEAGRPENIEDIRAYLHRELGPFAKDGKSLLRAVNVILEKSEGLFLYVSWLCEELRGGRLSLDGVEDFPRGLGGVYSDFFRRYFADLQEYARDCRPILEVVCAAREPLAPTDLVAMFGLSEYEMQSLRARLGSLFPIAANQVRPFHQSVNDWLTDNQRAGPYYVHVEAGEQRLAAFAWEQYRNRERERSHYCSIHAVAHLAACHRQREVMELLTDWEWVQGKLAATDPSRLAADYDYIREEPGVEAIQAAIRLASHALAFRPSELRTQLVGRLRSEEFDSLKALLNNILSSTNKDPWLLPLSTHLGTPGGPLLRTLYAHRDEVSSVAVDHKGNTAVSIAGGEIKTWDLQDGTEIATAGIGQIPQILALAYDGQGLTISTASGGFAKWRIPGCEDIETFGRKYTSCTATAISRNQRMFAVGSLNGSIYVFDEHNNISKRGWAHFGEVRALALSDDGGTLISSGTDGQVRLWKTTDLSRELGSWATPSRSCLALALSADGDRVLCLREDGRVSLWDTTSGKELGGRILPADMSMAYLRQTLDRSVAVFARQDGSISVCDIAMNSMAAVGTHGELSCLALSGDGSKLITGSIDGTLKSWDLDRVQAGARTEHPQRITALKYATEDSFVAGTADGTVSFWSAKDGAYLRRLTSSEGALSPVHAIWVTCHSQRLVTRSQDGSVRVWNTQSGEILKTLTRSHWPQIVAVMPDGQFAGYVLEDKLPKVKNVYFPSHWNCSVPHIQAQTLVVIARDLNLIQLWNVERETQLGAYVSDVLISVAQVAEDGSRIVAGGYDGSVMFWDTSSGSSVRSESCHAGRITAIGISFSGEVAITTSEDGIAYVWDPGTGAQITSFTGDGALTSCAVNPDASLIAVGDSSGAVHVLKLCLGD
jgi:WD40 repeat protein